MKVGKANYWNDPESSNSAQELGPMVVCKREPLVNHQANGVIIKILALFQEFDKLGTGYNWFICLGRFA